MSNSDSRRSGVPSWQLQSNSEESKKTQETSPEAPSRETILEQAKKFLEEDEVRNAPMDKKIAFFEEKGLHNDEIETLLGVSRNPEASTPPLQTTPSPTEPSPAPSPPQPSYTPQQNSTPPIITYPEFLTTPTYPTPLMTTSRLLTTLYLTSGLSALIYGTNTYLLTPMLDSLTSSRLSLAATTSENLSTLIQKLEGAVSELPTNMTGGSETDAGEDSDEDPSEMFHRDIGIQTSLPSTPGPVPPTEERTHLSSQTDRLASLSKEISGLVEDSTAEGYEGNELSATVGVLREYLDGLAYVAPSYGYGAGGYGLGGSGREEVDDEIGRVKAGIRGVKGVLLNARSFPGVRAR